MRKLIVLFAAAVMMTSFAAAQTASGALTVTATVNSSINLVFVHDTNGVALTSGEGTSTATLDFGNVSAFGALPINVSRPSVTATNFTVSTPVDVVVTSANSSSANYLLKVELNNPRGTETWAANGVAFDSTAAQTAVSAGTYGSKVPVTLALTIPFATTSGTTISNIVNFTASAN